MTKSLLTLIMFSGLFFGCQRNKDLKSKTPTSYIAKSEDTLNKDERYQIETLKHEFSMFKYFNLTEVIKEDLNGDSIAETTKFVKGNGKSGLLIKDGRTGEEVKIGMGEPFEPIGDDLGWVDFWGITYDKTAGEVIVNDSEIVGGRDINLTHPSIILRKEEEGGGLITFKNGKYIWIHQAD